jgi:hypothetical protein
MVKAQCRVLLLAAVLAMGAIAAPRVQATSGRPAYVSVDLRDAPFEEALRQLFSGEMLRLANYVVESEPRGGTRATVKVTRMRATEALTAVLSQYGMTYRWVGHTIWISPEAERPEAERRLILYLRRNGDRTQLRLRASPYENGGEKLLWESPKDVRQSTHLFPSPSFTYAAISWWGSCDPIEMLGPRTLLVPLAGGEVKKIETPGMVRALVWTQDDKLEIVGSKDEHWRYHPSTGALTEEPLTGDGVLEAAYATQAQALERVLSKVKAPPGLPTDDLQSLLRAGVWSSRSTGAQPQAAVSPDGRYAALAGAEAAVYIVEVATGDVRQKILPTRLVDTESVGLGHLHWSQDSTRLLFTESHFHAARYHTMYSRVDSMPSVTDWTELVREYSLASDQTRTLTIGYDAHEVPPEAADALLAGSNPRDWEAADHQWRWGRTARKEADEWSPEEERKIRETLEAGERAFAARQRSRARRTWLYGSLTGAGVVLACGAVVLLAKRGRRGRANPA